MILEISYQSNVMPVGKLDDVTIYVDSWEYPVDLLILHTKSRVGGHSLILGRPWLTTTNAYIGCRYGNMVISNGGIMKNLFLHPPSKPSSLVKPKFI